MEKLLIILRHVSGAGSSTLAKFLISNLSCSSSHYEADHWMMEDGQYKFSVEKLGFAHNCCKKAVESDMKKGIEVICLTNTLTTEKELKPYLDLAEFYGYKVNSLIVENRHNNKDIHGLNEEILIRQENRLRGSIKLR